MDQFFSSIENHKVVSLLLSVYIYGVLALLCSTITDTISAVQLNRLAKQNPNAMRSMLSNLHSQPRKPNPDAN